MGLPRLQGLRRRRQVLTGNYFSELYCPFPIFFIFFYFIRPRRINEAREPSNFRHSLREYLESGIFKLIYFYGHWPFSEKNILSWMNKILKQTKIVIQFF